MKWRTPTEFPVPYNLIDSLRIIELLLFYATLGKLPLLHHGICIIVHCQVLFLLSYSINSYMKKI